MDEIKIGNNTLLEADVLLAQIHEKLVESAYERNLLYGILLHLIGNDDFIIELTQEEVSGRLVMERIEGDFVDEGYVKYRIYSEPYEEELE